MAEAQENRGQTIISSIHCIQIQVHACTCCVSLNMYCVYDEISRTSPAALPTSSYLMIKCRNCSIALALCIRNKLLLLSLFLHLFPNAWYWSILFDDGVIELVWGRLCQTSVEVKLFNFAITVNTKYFFWPNELLKQRWFCMKTFRQNWNSSGVCSGLLCLIRVISWADLSLWSS